MSLLASASLPHTARACACQSGLTLRLLHALSRTSLTFYRVAEKLLWQRRRPTSERAAQQHSPLLSSASTASQSGTHLLVTAAAENGGEWQTFPCSPEAVAAGIYPLPE